MVIGPGVGDEALGEAPGAREAVESVLVVISNEL